MEVEREVYLISDETGGVYLGTVGEIIGHANGRLQGKGFAIAVSDLLTDMASDPLEGEIQFTLNLRPKKEERDGIQS